VIASERKREDVAAAREQWQAWQSACETSNLVFLDETGLRVDRITAPWCVDQAMNGEAFKEYCRSQLGPTLRPGDIVICDNLPAHKVAEVQDIIEAQGATLKYLPPYSPDLNPIEQVFAKLKALLRKAAERTYDKLWQTTGQLLNQFRSEECLNFFRNSGYVFN
jgi:transposase